MKVADPFILLGDLARHPNVNRTALDLAVRGGKLTPVTRSGRLWVLRTDADLWLSSCAARGFTSRPRYDFEL